MNGTQTMAEATVPFEYSVPVDPMDELQCDSCQ
ncbi:MAG: hypothetical protein JWM70_1351 [Microbacteriaceae bacterium]|jgi:hypothetical protein|nr:hypothetical protein [Microbacteriaceae bacterium]